MVLRAVEFISQNVSQCKDLRMYTDCFQTPEICYDSDEENCDTSAPYRQPGGKCNNLENSKLGTKYAAYGRLVAAHYYDCM